jgi:excisionase family DNA binding protein
VDLLCGFMNTTQETECLQNALAGLATVMTKIVNERVEQALAESLPVSPPVNAGNRFAADRLLNKKQMAELLNVTPRSVDNWMKRGLLPYLKIGRSVRFDGGNVFRHLDGTALVDRGGRSGIGLMVR